MAKIEIHKVKEFGETVFTGIDSETRNPRYRARTERMAHMRARLYGYTEIEKKY